MQLHAEVPVAVTDIIATNPSVSSYSPFWFGVMSLSHASMPTSRRLAWYAIDPEKPAVDVPGLKENLHKLRETRRILFDRDSRPISVISPPRPTAAPNTQCWGRPTIAVCAPALCRRHLRRRPERAERRLHHDEPGDHGRGVRQLVVRPSGLHFDPPVAWRRRQCRAPAAHRTLVGRGEAIDKREFEARERVYWSRETPVGYITDLGFIMGVMIGMVFIYYAQYQIIRFYLPEYAILKSLGYDWWFFLFMIGQIGAAIITPAFVVSFALARLVYGITEAAMHLGMSMGLREMTVALVACMIMTVVSSLFAIRRLWKVDPIMLFE